MLLSSTTVNGAVSNDSNNNITMSVGNTVTANVNSSGIFFESGKKAIYTGAVLQVVSYTLSGSFQTTSTSLTATGLIATITPISSTSKIFVTMDINNTHKSGGSPVNMYQYFSLYRQINSGGYSQLRYFGYQGGMSNGTNGGDVFGGSNSFSYLDSPSTTSTINYQLYFSGDNASYYVYMGEASSTCTITAMEIAG